jgi:hypothetical protein
MPGCNRIPLSGYRRSQGSPLAVTVAVSVAASGTVTLYNVTIAQCDDAAVLTYRKYKNRFHLSEGCSGVAFDSMRNRSIGEGRKTNGQQPVKFRMADKGTDGSS